MLTPPAGQVWKSYYFVGSVRIAMRVQVNGAKDQVYYLLTDHLGSTTVSYRADGQETRTQSYKPWGELRGSGNSLPTDRTFTGQRWSASIGLSFFNARWYDSGLGRFISPDTIIPGVGNVQAWDRYLYALGNPIRFIDPNGHKACAEITSYGECIPDDVEVSDLPDIPEGPPQGDPTTPVQTGLEWLSGRGPRHHEFRGSDPFTQELMKHPHLDYVRELIAARLRSGIYTTENVNYNLSGFQGVPKYVKDYSTLTTGGKIGNLAVTYLGSYALEYYVVSVNFETNEAVVLIHVNNSSTLSSATRPPVIGYLPVWTEYIEPQINRLTSSGPMSKTTQEFWWQENIQFR